MKNFQSFFFGVAAAMLLMLSACNDSTVIGSDLLSGDELEIDFTDTLTLVTYSMEEDSVRLFDSQNFGISFENLPVGDFADPIFGTTRSTVYAQPTLNVSLPNFSTGVLDSIVLVLPWNTEGVYGNMDELYSLEVWELAEQLKDSSQFYSNREYGLKQLIGEKEFTPRPADSVVVNLPGQDSSIKVAPQLRIKLNTAFENNFFDDDTLKFGTVDAFQEFFKGFAVRPKSQNNGMLNFWFRAPQAGIRVYYHEDTVFRDYLFPIFSTSVVTAFYEHDYAGTFVEPYLGKNAAIKDSLLFIQGMSGINLVVEFPTAQYLGDIVVNQAVLVLPVLRLPEDDPTLNPIEQIIVSEIITDSTLTVIDDVIFAGSNFVNVFGGQVGAGDVYKLNISSYFQDMMRGLKSNKIKVTVFLKPEYASRVVLAGPKYTDKSAKLQLTFTRY